jgi:putative phosphoribosyl transferase
MFRDRQQAGELLAKKLKSVIGSEKYIVVPLLRGGVVLGKKIADCFGFIQKPLAVKKIGAPVDKELGIGAVTIDKTYYFNEEIIRGLNISDIYKQAVLEEKYKEAKILQKRIERFVKNISFENKNIIVVDDGVAVGNTVICASLYLQKQKAQKIILAVPVISKESIELVNKYFDKIIALKIEDNLGSIGQFYKSFPQVTEEEVIELL